MNVIVDTTNTNAYTIGRVDDLVDVAMQTFQMLVVNFWTGRFHMENDVQIDFAKGLWHDCVVYGLLP